MLAHNIAAIIDVRGTCPARDDLKAALPRPQESGSSSCPDYVPAIVDGLREGVLAFDKAKIFDDHAHSTK